MQLTALKTSHKSANMLRCSSKVIMQATLCYRLSSHDQLVQIQLGVSCTKKMGPAPTSNQTAVHLLHLTAPANVLSHAYLPPSHSIKSQSTTDSADLRKPIYIAGIEFHVCSSRLRSTHLSDLHYR